MIPRDLDLLVGCEQGDESLASDDRPPRPGDEEPVSGLRANAANGFRRFTLGSIALLILLGCSRWDTRPAEPYNVVVVVLDAARADHFGSYGYARNTTPVADAFAAQATRYETVISEAPFTFLATSSLFSAGSPAVTGLVGHAGGIVPESLELISETAQQAGFATLAYSENPYVTHDFGLDQGFDYFEEAFPAADYRRRQGLDPDVDSAARLAAAVERAASDSSRPFFFYAHLLRPHNPYAPPPPYAGRFGSQPTDGAAGESRALVALDRKGGPFEREHLEKITRLYDENLAYADGLFGHLLAELTAHGLREQTIVILTSDHGEAFGEHGRLLHSSQLYDSMLRIPLIVDVPGHERSVVATPVQLADLGRGLRDYFLSASDARPGAAGALSASDARREAAGALSASDARAEAAGVSRAESAAHGGDAAGALTRLGVYRTAGEPLYSWTNANPHLVSARTERRKLVIDAVTFGVVAYHDLFADPDELRPIALDREGREMLPGLLTKIGEWVGIEIPVEAALTIEPERRRQLEALGYLEPSSGD